MLRIIEYCFCCDNVVPLNLKAAGSFPRAKLAVSPQKWGSSPNSTGSKQFIFVLINISPYFYTGTYIMSLSVCGRKGRI